MKVRSWLCSSSLKAGLFDKAAQVGVDIAHLDLEDSVPAAQKDAARFALISQLATPGTLTTALRINALGTSAGLKDLLFLVENRLCVDIVILPKVSSMRDVSLAGGLLRAINPSVKLFAVIETVEAFRGLRSLSAVPACLGGFIFGAADFAADLGVDRRLARLGHVKQEICMTARQFGLVAIDSPCLEFRDPAKLRAEIEEATALGFTGKIAIHPAQVAAINESFIPTQQAIDHALSVLEVQADVGDSAIAELGDEMIGPPFVRRAHEVLARAKQLPQVDDLPRPAL